MEDTASTDSEDNEPFDCIAMDLDRSRVDPGDDNLAKEATPCDEAAIIQSNPLKADDEDELNEPISLHRSPEDPCLPRKIYPDTMTPPPKTFVQRIQNKINPPNNTDVGSVPLAIPGLQMPGGSETHGSRRSDGARLSVKDRFRNISRQIKLGRLKQAGQLENPPKIYLLVPKGQEHFLRKSSLSGLAKKRHFEDDISDDDISAFDKADPKNEGEQRSGLGRIFSAVVGCIRGVLRGFADCVWRCFGGDPEPEEPVRFRKTNTPRIEFNSLLDPDDNEDSLQPERSSPTDVRYVCQTTV